MSLRRNKKLINWFWRDGGSIATVIDNISLLVSGGRIVADYDITGTEQNRPPWVLDVVVSGVYEEDEVLTITCTWDKNSSGTVGTSTLGVYRHDTKNTIAGAINRTLITTLSNGVDSAARNIITTTYSYTIVAADVGKFLSFDFTAKVTGVANTDSSVFSSDLSDAVTPDLPAIYATVNPEHLLLKGEYNSTLNEWLNVGSEGGVWVGTGATKETGGEVTFASGGLSKTISAAAGADFCAWGKFTWTDNAEVKTIFEMSNNRQMEVFTNGAIRLRATTVQSTTGLLSMSTTYNFICEHLASGNFYVRVELNNGTLVLEETLTGTGTVGITSGAATIFQDLEFTNQNAGVLHEFGCKYGTVSAGNKTDILTRLKAI